MGALTETIEFGKTGLHKTANDCVSKADGAASSSATSISVTDATNNQAWPTADFAVYNKATGEIFYVTSRSGNTLTIDSASDRGFGGTAAAAITDGDELRVVHASEPIQVISDAVNDLSELFHSPGSGRLKWDESNKRLGIGKVPSTTLDVDGTVTATSFSGDGSGLTGIASGTGGVTNTGSTTIGADTDSDGTGVIALQTRGTTRFTVENDGSLTFKQASQDYKLSGTGSILHLTSQTSGLASGLRLFTKDGDGTDTNSVDIYLVGTDGSLTNTEGLKFRGRDNDTFEIKTFNEGTGTLRPLHLFTGSATGQLVLLANGDVTSSASNLNITADNVGVGQSTYGTSAAKVLAIGSGTRPTTSPSDAVQLWTEDLFASGGASSLHGRNEQGNQWAIGADGAANNNMTLQVNETVDNLVRFQGTTNIGSVSSLELIGRVEMRVTQADPSALKSEMRLSVNNGDSLEEVLRLDDTPRVDFRKGSVALGGGSGATLGTIGGSGPTTAGQDKWLEIKIAGTTHWVPAWT